MIIKTHKSIPNSEITDPVVFKQRRQLIKAMLALGITGSAMYSDFSNASEAKWQNLPNGQRIKTINCFQLIQGEYLTIGLLIENQMINLFFIEEWQYSEFFPRRFIQIYRVLF